MSQCTKTGTPTGKFMWLNIQIKYGTYVSQWQKYSVATLVRKIRLKRNMLHIKVTDMEHCSLHED